jgi:hypothetical protein
MNRQPMPIRASLFGVPAKPDHAAIPALIEAARLCVRQEIFGCKTVQFSHAGQFTPDIQLGESTCRPTFPQYASVG